jgi:hypothetical protein
MPIFQDDLGGGRETTTPTKQAITSPLPKSPGTSETLKRKISEESIRTELCEGPLLDSPPSAGVLLNGLLENTFEYPVNGTSDRVELIERLKRGETPSWLPNRNVWKPNLLIHRGDLTLC